MTLTVYGSAQSRTMRILWIAEELGLDYAHDPVAWNDPRLKTPEFLKISPSGRIPAIVDDGLALFESLAITLYLAKSRGSPLYPGTVQGEALAWAWTLWATFELEAPLAKDSRLPAADSQVAEALATLERELESRPYVLGEDFTVADLNLACVLSPSRLEGLDLAPYAKVRDWLERCSSRPARIASRHRVS